MNVSVLILTRNEERNLQACLAALAWCDDIVVLDSGSTDRTVEFAGALGARVMTRRFDNFAQQRNYGLMQGGLRHEWVLHLDADEVVTPEFVLSLRTLEPRPDIDAYQVPSKTMFFGKWLRYAGMWPSYQVRLGRRDKLRFVQVGHGQRESLPPDRVGVFPEAYLHYSFSHGLVAWLHKHVEYASDEAELLVTPRDRPLTTTTGGGVSRNRRFAKLILNRMPTALRPLLKFLYVYVVRWGFLDGWRGFAYAFMLAVYEGMIAVIAFEHSERAVARPAPKRESSEEVK